MLTSARETRNDVIGVVAAPAKSAARTARQGSLLEKRQRRVRRQIRRQRRWRERCVVTSSLRRGDARSFVTSTFTAAASDANNFRRSLAIDQLF